MESWDVVVVGGGPAGLAGGIALARSLRSVVVLDAGEPRNASATGAHNLLGHEGIAPHELLARGRAELAGYGGTVRSVRARGARREDGGLVVRAEDGSELRARRLLVTSGLRDELPEVSGLRQRWGQEVLHCPFCHGWEVRGQQIVVLASGPMSTHQALLFAQLSEDVTLLTHTAPPADADRGRLAAAGVAVVDGVAAGLEGTPLTGVRLADGGLVPAQALVVAPYMRAQSPVLEELGLAAVQHASGVGEHYPSEMAGRTALPGVWVAGNVTDLTAQVGASAAAGTLAGAAIHGDLVEEDVTARLASGGRAYSRS